MVETQAVLGADGEVGLARDRLVEVGRGEPGGSELEGRGELQVRRQGVADFLTVLVAESSLLAAQQQLASSTTTVSSNLVALYKALGGGWEVDMPEAKPAKS